MICFCGAEYTARKADLKRGWARACCKSCASKKREFSKPNPKFLHESEAFKLGKKKKRTKKPNDKRELNRIKSREEAAIEGGYAPFDSLNQMCEALCDNPMEGR